MPISHNLSHYLNGKKVPYQVMTHDETFTALETAEKQHVPGDELVKTVVVKGKKGNVALAVLPSTCRINLEQLGKCMKWKEIALVPEDEFTDLFPECELGAMPPIGELYHLPIWVDETLTWDKEIVFNAGSHTDTIKMSFLDFERMVKPHFGAFAYRMK